MGVLEDSCLRILDLYIFTFSIKDSALSLFFQRGFEGFTEVSLGSEEAAVRYFGFRSCGVTYLRASTLEVGDRVGVLELGIMPW